MHLIPETSDPTFAGRQIASEISSASAYGPYSEKNQAECVLLTSFFCVVFLLGKQNSPFLLLGALRQGLHVELSKGPAIFVSPKIPL